MDYYENRQKSLTFAVKTAYTTKISFYYVANHRTKPIISPHHYPKFAQFHRKTRYDGNLSYRPKSIYAPPYLRFPYNGVFVALQHDQDAGCGAR